MGIFNTLVRAVTWWNGQTLNTQFFTWRKGVKVGHDTSGNTYYRTSDGKRRWVIFNGDSEASRVSPDWHGWLHHTWMSPQASNPLPGSHGKSRIRKILRELQRLTYQQVQSEGQTFKRALIMRLGNLNRM